MDINTVIFDFDKVISPDNSEIVHNRFKQSIKDPNFQNRLLASPKLYQCLRGKIPYEEYVNEIGNLANIDSESAHKFANSMVENRLANREIISLIEELRRQDITLVLYTDQMKVPFDVWTRKFNLRNLFNFTICSAYMGSLKNDPESWQKVLKHINKRPNRCLLVDSSKSNIYTAEKAGIQGINFIDVGNLPTQLEDYKILTK